MVKNTHSTIASNVFQQLKNEIITGAIPQGQKISEVSLSTRLGISRGPLREALRLLEAINLIERTPHSGSKVVSLSYSKIRELYQIRELMEGFATRLAASQMTRPEIDTLYRLLDSHHNQIESSGTHVYLQEEGDKDFHYYIYSKCNNQWLLDYLDKNLYQLIMMCRQQTALIPSRADLGISEHIAIIDAISDRDPEFAEILMKRHIKGAWETVKRLIFEVDLESK
jgi:DNA-binding GntR family transcriptional regulator